MKKVLSLFILLSFLFAVPLPAQADYQTQVENYVKQKLTSPSPRGKSGYDKPFQGGNNIAAMVATLAKDLAQHVIDFYSGEMRWSVIGMCIKCSTFGCSFYPYQEYHWPYEMSEVAGWFQGEYTPDLLFDLYRPVYQDGVLGIFSHYEGGGTFAPLEIERAQIWANRLPDGRPAWPPGVPAVPSGKAPGNDGSHARALNQAVTGGDGPREGMTTLDAEQRQYHLFSPLSQVVNFPQAPLGNCHQLSNNSLLHFRSDNPLYMFPGNYPMLSDFLFQNEMLKRFDNPGYCISNDLNQGQTLPFQRKFLKTAFGIGLPGRPGHQADRDLCLTTNGMMYPISTRVANARSFPNAYRTLLMRANNFFREIQPGMIQDFAMYDGSYDSSKADRIKIERPGGLSTGSSQSIYAYKGFKHQINAGDPRRGVATTWKYLRCCPSGYRILWGPRPQLKGLHAFNGGRA